MGDRGSREVRKGFPEEISELAIRDEWNEQELAIQKHWRRGLNSMCRRGKQVQESRAGAAAESSDYE